MAQPFFYFAWVDAGEAFNPAVHDRVDEHIVAFRVEQMETELCSMSIDIFNPRIGLLNSGRKRWAWLAWYNQEEAMIESLFFGRVVGFPTNFNKNKITLEFIARPSDFGNQKADLAAGLRNLPYFDPVFIRDDALLDPDVVLEARTQVWHIDRITHEVSISDLIEGEDGVLEFQEEEIMWESVETSFNGTPVRRVRMTASTEWDQVVSGNGLPCIKDMQVDTLAGAGLIGGWPKGADITGGAGIGGSNIIIEGGESLGGGWKVTTGSARSPYQNLEDNDYAYWYTRGYTLNEDGFPIYGLGFPPFYLSVVSAYSASVPKSGPASSSGTLFSIISDKVTLNLTLGYEATRKYKDTIIFDLIADSQSIVTEPDDEDYLEMSFTGNDVSLPDPFDEYETPIGGGNRRSYFAGDRGQQSIQYLIQLARANIVHRSRAVQVKWKCKFARAIEASLRKNALIHDRNLPGGQAVGKIVSYSFGAEGGEISGEIVIQSCIGRGGSIAPVDGVNVYADDYIDDYFFEEGQILVLGAGDVGFTRFSENPNDDGLIFPLRAVPYVVPPNVFTVFEKELTPVPPTSDASTQIDDCGNTTSASVSSSLDTGPYNDWLSGIKTTVDFRLKAVEGGPFETTYLCTVTDLKLPMQIDLEAGVA